MIAKAAAFLLVMVSASPAAADNAPFAFHPSDVRLGRIGDRVLFVDDRKLLGLIGRVEGASSYDIIYHGSRIRPPKPITSMTIGEVRAFQDRMVAAGSRSSAVGLYQFIRNTLPEAMTAAGLGPDDAFSPFNQDRMARSLLKKCGFYDYRTPEERIGDCVAGRWAAIPRFTGPGAGRSAHHGIAGNRSLVGVSETRESIAGRFRDYDPGAVSGGASQRIIAASSGPVRAARMQRLQRRKD